MSNKITTIDMYTSTRDHLRKICKEEGRTYDGIIRYWIGLHEKKIKNKKNK